MQLRVTFVVVLSILAPSAFGQLAQAQATVSTPLAASAPTVVPALISYIGSSVSSEGQPLPGEVNITFLFFKEASGGEPLWTESQRVIVDTTGAYKVQLGATQPSGLPLELFADGQARWIEAQIAGQRPQPRVLLTTVPYAAKAADAATLGGLPASAFVLAASNPGDRTVSNSGIVADASGVTTTGGTTGKLPVFTGASSVGNSEIYDTGTSVGIGSMPNASAKLDVQGAMIIRGNTIVSRSGNATTSAGFPSYAFDFYANAYNTSTKTNANPAFAIQSEPVGNNTSSPSATLNVLYSATGQRVETGFFINPTGILHFTSGQTFPGAGSVSSVALSAPASDFTVSSSPVTTAGTLGLNWNVAPTSANVANAIVKRDGDGSVNVGNLTTGAVTVANSMQVDQGMSVFASGYRIRCALQ
jgi:hypothetical protein